ncbi:MAG: PAS domain S-box protein [Stygiobacter sp.]
MKNKYKLQTISKKQIIAFITVLSVLIIISGYIIFKKQADILRQEKYNELHAIADLKVNQIKIWLHERETEAKVATQSPFFIGGIDNWLQNTTNVKLKQDIIKRLKLIKKEMHYENIFLANTNGDILISVTDDLEESNNFLKQKISDALTKGEIVFTDFYFSQNKNKINFDNIAPIINNKNKTIAVLIFRIDPNHFLYPLIQTWPTPSKSAETALFKVERDSIVFLNELRHRKNSALRLKFPLTQTELPSVQAALGRTGLYEGIDYRGVKVLSDIRKIHGTNWFMLAKVDLNEIFRNINVISGIIMTFTFLLIIACGVGIAFIYNTRQKTIYKELYNKEKEIWQHQEKFKVTMDSLGEGIITLDTNGKVQYINSIAEEMTGWNLREARGRNLHEIYPVKNEETGQIENNILDKIYKHGIVKELANHTILITKSGKEIPVMDTGAPIYDTNGSILGIVIAFQDETDKRRQHKLLSESEYRLRSTFDSMLEGCQILSNDWNYLFINDTAEKHNRRPKEELLGKKYMDMWPDIEDTEVFKLIKKCMEFRTPQQIENEFIFPDGTIGFFNVKIEPVPEGVLILTEDITERKQAEKSLREKTNILESFFENTLTLVAMLDKDFNFIRVNKAYADVDEKDVDFFIGKNHFDLYPSDAKEIFEEVKRTKKSYHAYERPFTYQYNPERGVTYWDWSLVPLLDENNEVQLLIFTLLNVTERVITKMKLVENEKFLTSLFDSMNDVIYTTTLSDRIIRNANKAVYDIFGYNPEEIIGKQVKVLYSSEEIFLEYGKVLSSAIKENKNFVRAELLMKRKDGTEFYCDVQTTFINSFDKDVLAISVLRDITEKKKLINELIDSKEKAEEMNRLKSSFLANMSHELRTPLIGILGFADILIEELKDHGLKEMAEKIYKSGMRLSETLNLILDLSKLESEKDEFNYEKIDLIKETKEVLDLFSKTAEKRGLYLKSSFSHPRIQINIDERAYRTILNNLINNALKFTDEGGVNVDISLNKNLVEIKVKDTGIGIPYEYQKIIFEEFRQVSEGLGRNFEGTGLGLNITKKLVEKFGGEISVESELRKGSTFIVKLPIITDDKISKKKVAIPIHEERLKYEAPKVKPLALIVDDDPLVYPVIKRYLEDYLELESTTDGEFAINLCKKKKYDLIFMDINLKRGIDGKQVTRKLRKIKEYVNVPIIATTAYAMIGDREEFLAAGCSHYISKPFKKEDLLDLVVGILNKKT